MNTPTGRGQAARQGDIESHGDGKGCRKPNVHKRTGAERQYGDPKQTEQQPETAEENQTEDRQGAGFQTKTDRAQETGGERDTSCPQRNEGPHSHR